MLQTVILEGITRLQLPTHPHPYICVIRDITVIVKSGCIQCNHWTGLDWTTRLPLSSALYSILGKKLFGLTIKILWLTQVIVTPLDFHITLLLLPNLLWQFCYLCRYKLLPGNATDI